MIDIDKDSDIVTLEEDLPPVESEGDQEYLRAMLIAQDYGGDANIFLPELLLAIIKFEQFSGEYDEFHFQFII